MTHCIVGQIERFCACFLPKICPSVWGDPCCVLWYMAFCLRPWKVQQPRVSLFICLYWCFISLVDYKPLAVGEDFLCDFTETNAPHPLSFGGALSTHQLTAKNIFTLGSVTRLIFVSCIRGARFFFHLNFLLMTKIVIYSVSIKIL